MKTEKLIEQLSEDNVPVTPMRPLRSYIIWVTIALIIAGAVTLLLGVRSDMSSKLNSTLYMVEMFSALATGLLAALAAHWLALPDVRQQKWVLWLPIFPLTVLVFMIGYQFFIQPLNLGKEEGQHAGCIMDVVYVATFPAILLFFLIYKAATTKSKLASTMAVISVLAFGYMSSRIICPSDALTHLLLWHYLPIVFFSIAGAFIGYRVLKW